MRIQPVRKHLKRGREATLRWLWKSKKLIQRWQICSSSCMQSHNFNFNVIKFIGLYCTSFYGCQYWNFNDWNISRKYTCWNTFWSVESLFELPCNGCLLLAISPWCYKLVFVYFFSFVLSSISTQLQLRRHQMYNSMNKNLKNQIRVLFMKVFLLMLVVFIQLEENF